MPKPPTEADQQITNIRRRQWTSGGGSISVEAERRETGELVGFVFSTKGTKRVLMGPKEAERMADWIIKEAPGG